MKTELAPTSSDLSLLPRADLPVIWDGFAAKAEQLRLTAETLTVTSVEQKAEMELARTTRLTLKQIRVEVEKKRVELGEGHLTEIQKINKAAKALKEAIEPLEARLLHQETYAERVEAGRVLELTKHRNDEIRLLRPGIHIPVDIGKMSNLDYDLFVARLRAEAAEIAEAKRRQVEAEAALAAEKAEAKRRQVEAEAALAEEQAAQRKLRDEQAQALLAQQAEAQRQARAAAAEAEARLAAERAEHRRKDEELLARLAEERVKENARRAEQAAEEKRVREALEAKRLELEVQLANERAAKLAEAEAARKLALAPDVEKLRNFAGRIQGIKCPPVTSDEAQVVVGEVSRKFDGIVQLLNAFCRE